MSMQRLINLNNIDQDSVFESEIGSEEDIVNNVRPYDPTLIRVEPKMFSLRNILDMIDEEELDLAPDFQRLTVWRPSQKSRLIESILLRIPLPAFYFASDKNGTLQVVDGVQRLSTIYNFVRGKVVRDRFALTDLEYLSDEVGNARFEDLKGSAWAKRIYSTQIVANVIDPQTPMRVKFDIFKRINTGGTPLNAQEIRHCMSGPRARLFLSRLSKNSNFKKATRGVLKEHVRMADREIILRIVAMHHLGLDAFLHAETMDDFLNHATQVLEDASDHTLGIIDRRFDRAMSLAFSIFGENSFRKWPIRVDKVYPINKAIFETLGAILCETSPSVVVNREDIIVERFRHLCSYDQNFLRSISQSTASASNVFERREKLSKIFETDEGDDDDL